jgi:ubiquinol-cytochrome c reductase iron-sulfur subunit
MPSTERGPAWATPVIAGSFLLSAASAITLTVVYAEGGDPQLEGIFLGLAFLGLAAGLITWAHRLLPHGPFAEPRPELAADPAERAATEADFERGGVLTRRRILVGSFATAAGALLAAAVFPIRSLGPAPDSSLERTPWRRGSRLIADDGSPVLADAVPVGGIVTAFPEGHPGSADGQIVLIRVEPDRLDLPRGRSGWAPEGLVAYSKICTHAGCPVGLYEAQRHQLLCPCHQSAFDVLRGAVPIFGPAARALPQLPLEIDESGALRAQRDFTEPVGPAYWSRS